MSKCNFIEYDFTFFQFLDTENLSFKVSSSYLAKLIRQFSLSQISRQEAFWTPLSFENTEDNKTITQSDVLLLTNLIEPIKSL